MLGFFTVGPNRTLQLRHLIVHNRGIVDHEFKRRTQCDEVYPVEKADVDANIETIADVVARIGERIGE